MLTLFSSPTSPFVRKVLMVAHETGLIERLQLQPTDIWAAGTELHQANPLGKIPALILDDNRSLYDSPVICEYLDTLHEGLPLFPAVGPARWTALRRQALADGICDAAVLRVLEARRPEEKRSAEWVERQQSQIRRSLDVLEAETGTLPSELLTIGELSILSALGYLDLRFAHENWRVGRPGLTAWFMRASDRPSFRATAPNVL